MLDRQETLKFGVGEAPPSDVVEVLTLPPIPMADVHYTFQRIPRGNVIENNHRLHKYPAKFIPQLPRWALAYKKSGREVVLDPFCGSGTTLVEAGLMGDEAIGFDINPLGVYISKAKTAFLADFVEDPKRVVSTIVRDAEKRFSGISRGLVEAQECLGLHRTWSFWFRRPEMAKLLALREAINVKYRSVNRELEIFLLACLSSVAKSASFLSEDQLKVRYDSQKNPIDPLISFPYLAESALVCQKQLGQVFRKNAASFHIQEATATTLPLKDKSVDRIITSPPYLNAVDYTMAHKYNLFVLGLVAPSDFKKHCREYIGMSERAVRSADLTIRPRVSDEHIRKEVHSLWSLATPTARNRAFVVAQYFNGMRTSLHEMRRVLRARGRIIMIAGYQNRICGNVIKTADMLEHLAHRAGLKTELRFFHDLANRSSIRLNRGATGGQVPFEAVYVFTRS